MSSPTKRRRKNGYNAADRPIRGLDFFFAKQRDAQREKVQERTVDVNQDPPGPPDVRDTHGLTDEELARKLQAQWTEDDRKSDDTPSVHQEEGQNVPVHDREDAQMPHAANMEVSDDTRNPSSQLAVASEKSKNTLALQFTAIDEDAVTANIPFDESALTFEPSKYIPDLQKEWEADGGHVSYALLTRCFVLVNSTQSRIKIVDTLVNLLRTIIEADPDSLLPTVWLSTNAISPPYIDLELGLGGSAITKALKKICGLDNAGLKTLYNKYGDAGDVAFEAKKRQSFTLRKPKPLTAKSVFESLIKIANSKGQGSQEVKQRIVERLIQDARGSEESRYIVRTLVQHLRIGAVKTTMLIALSRAFLLSRPSRATFPVRSPRELSRLTKEELTEIYQKAEEVVKASFARRPNYNDLVPTLLEIGVCDELLLRCGLALHIPLRPMLGSITRDLGDMLTKLHCRNFTCEFKYDGQRAQVHCDQQGKVSIFSRHLEVMTEKYPDLVALVPQIRGEGVNSFILEGEVVAIDRSTGELKPFQTLSNRARKDVVIHSVKIDVCLFAFDLMYLNGEELLGRPFRERRNLLRSLFVEIPHHFAWVKSLDATSADSEAVLEFFKSATDIKCEGIMVKVLDNPPEMDMTPRNGDDELLPSAPTTPRKQKKGPKAKKTGAMSNDEQIEKDKGSRRKALLSTYEPDKRLDSWLKVKKDYNTSADTIDLIPVAGWHGLGRKSKWWSPILLAARNPETGTLVAVTKCISGFTDAFYAANRAKYDPDSGQNVISRPSYVEYGGCPDVWFEPQEVWEMAFADVTLSPTYTSAIGLVSEERGLSLRFPRFLKVREDKSIEEANTDEFLAELWRKQQARAPAEQQGNDKQELDMEEE